MRLILIDVFSYVQHPIFEQCIIAWQKMNRPVICSEYMARPRGSTFLSVLPLAKQYNVGVYNWGFVNGKTECNFPWDSWKNPYIQYRPDEWFHEIFQNDGTPYMAEETNLIKQYNGKWFWLQPIYIHAQGEGDS
jgi:hypothetical protein